MRSDRRRQILLGLVILALVPWAWHSLSGRTPQQARAAGKPAAASEAHRQQPVPLLDPQRIGALRRWVSAPWPENPFDEPQPEPTRKTFSDRGASRQVARSRGRYVLNAILAGGESRAVINGRVVAAGDTVPPDGRVVAVREHEVVLETPHGSVRLVLSP